MQTSSTFFWSFLNAKTIILIIGFICAAFICCAYWMYRHSEAPTFQPILVTPSDMVQSDAPSIIHVQATMEVIHDDVVTYQLPCQNPKNKQTKAQQLFDELFASSANFQKALENPRARANIERMLTHPEIEKKLNGWFASLIRSAIWSKVDEPNFPELVATENYVDDLFKQYGIS